MTPKILIVDDEEINRLTLEGILTGEGYDIHVASRGSEVCEQARRLRPDLILLDVMMPDLDGFSVCQLIRADRAISRIPIILITALDDDASRLAGLRAGADEFITKPCHRAELQARVRTIVMLNRFRTIAEQHARFEQLYDLAPLAIVMAEADGRVLKANRQANSLLTSPPPGEPAGINLAAHLDAASFAAVRASIHDALAGRIPGPCEIRVGATTTERIMQLRVAPVPGGNGDIALLLFDDVTTEVQARSALKQLNADLEKTVRARTAQLEEANTLLMSYASFVSHELCSPLTVIKGYLAMLEEGVVPINEEASPLVRQAMSAARLMEESITNILQLARDTHAGHARRPVEAVDPTPLVGRLIEHLRGAVQNQQTRFIVGELPAIGASAVVLERVLYNLLMNAVKYSAAQATPCVEIGATIRGGEPVLFVRDNGVGFDPGESERLFREFSRLSTAAHTEGLGLGLSFVARLVSAHGGRIWAEGEPGSGATFYVQFPEPAASTAGSPQRF